MKKPEIEDLLDELGNWEHSIPDNRPTSIQFFLDGLAQTYHSTENGRFLKNLAYQYERLGSEEYTSERGKALTGRHLCEALLNAASCDAIKSFQTEISQAMFRVKSIEEILIYRDGGSLEMLLLLESGSSSYLFLQIAHAAVDLERPSYFRLYPCEGFRFRQFEPVAKGSPEDNHIASEIDSAIDDGRVNETVDIDSLRLFVMGMARRLA